MGNKSSRGTPPNQRKRPDGVHGNDSRPSATSVRPGENATTEQSISPSNIVCFGGPTAFGVDVYFGVNKDRIQSSQSRVSITSRNPIVNRMDSASRQRMDTDTIQSRQSRVGITFKDSTVNRMDSALAHRMDTEKIQSSQSRVGITSRDPIVNRMDSASSQRMDTDTIQISQSRMGITSRDPIVNRMDSALGHRMDTEKIQSSQSRVGITSRDPIVNSMDSALGQRRNTDTIQSIQSRVSITSRDPIVNRMDSASSQRRDTDTIQSSPSRVGITFKDPTMNRMDSELRHRMDTDTIQSSQSRVGITSRDPIVNRMDSASSQRRDTDTIQSSPSRVGITFKDPTMNRMDSELRHRMDTDTIQISQSRVGITSRDPIVNRMESALGQRRNTDTIQSSQSRVGVTSRDPIVNRMDSALGQRMDTDRIKSSVVVTSPISSHYSSLGVPDPQGDASHQNAYASNTDICSSNRQLSIQEDSSADQVEGSNTNMRLSNLPFSLDPQLETSSQVEKSSTDMCSSNFPFSLQDDVGRVDESDTEISNSSQTFSDSDDMSSEEIYPDTSDESPDSGEGSMEPAHKECLLCITLPGAVDWQVALNELENSLQRINFNLQDLENKPSKLHSKNYIICFDNKSDLSRAMNILKLRKIKAVPYEDLINNFIQEFLEEKDEALKSHRQKCDEVMQSIESLQIGKGAKKSNGTKVKYIAFDEFEKRKAEKEAMLQKAQELNGQTKEFTVIISKLVEKVHSLKAVKVSWKELDSKLREVKQLLEREKDRLNKSLPIYAKKSLITNTTKDNQVCIILGETGSGKSTQVVQYLYDCGLAEKGIIVCTQPRKVAAFSLQKYVSEEMKEFGHLVECSVGARTAGKREKHPKILFTTDYSLLMECIKDQDLKRFSCVIIDEAHERNMNTDLLLGIIKNALPRRPDFRVIITSATIDPDLFVEYFRDYYCPVIKVSGKTFPVEVAWKKKQESSSDYVIEAVEKVLEIHENEGTGDILVFLTCPAEIEQACTKLRKKVKKEDDILFLPLHGKLQEQEQREVFKLTPKGKRKVVFSTNCAETSLTIPGIKFVVDTGKAKEMKYDPKRNLNSLEISVISQSSANQRKGRAGRTESGKCFRLYTEDDFNAMEKSSKPEILRINLGQALLKLMELGVSNPADFDYVESPPNDAIKCAMMELGRLGAIRDDGQLSEIGKKMAKVPVDPGLAKFMFEGFDQGVGYEALVLVSVATINGSVFFRVGSEEEKKSADMKKVEFCHLGGDFMTLLDVYRSWKKRDKRDQSRWCVEKSLNAKAMRMADETVKDLKSTLKHELKMHDINWSSLDKETTDRCLQKTLFFCFLTKLCVYTGHERKGYKTTSGGHFVKIHPSSSINFTGSNPQFIVYEKILKTSQDFLLNVTPVEKSWLQESITEQRINLDIDEILADVLMVTPPISIRCSSILMKKVCEPFKIRLPDLEKSISESCNNAPVVVDAKRYSGKLDLFVPKKYSDKAVGLVQRILEEGRKTLREDTRVWTVIAKSNDLRVILERGLTVQQILMPDMYRTVVMKNMQDREHVMHYLTQFGNIIELNFFQGMFFATYEKPEEARKAVEIGTIVELNFKVEPKKPRETSQWSREPSRRNGFTVDITWQRREPKGMANVSFDKQPDEIWLYAVSDMSTLKIRSSEARVRRDKHKCKSLFLQNLHPETTKQDIKVAIENVFPQISIEENDIFLQYKQRETPADTQKQEAILKTLLSDYVTSECFEVTVREIDISNKSPFGVAKVHFLNPNEGIQVVRSLSGKRVSGLEMWLVYLHVKPFFNFFDTCLKNVYDLVREEVRSKISEIAKQCAQKCNKRLQLQERPAKSKCRIELSVDTKCLDHYLQASKEISMSIQGERFECTKTFLFLISGSGRDHLKEIQKETGAFIYADERTMGITVYGTSQQKEKARDAVYSLMQGLILSGSTVWEVSLKEAGRPRGLLKEMMTKYGRELQGLRRIPGVNNVIVYLQKQVLKIQSTDDAKSKVLYEIDELAKTMAPTQPKMREEIEEEMCPTCFCGFEDETTPYRLATCGHAYHMPCIKEQLNAAVFPFCCTHETCPEMFTQQDMTDLITETELQNRIIKMSLKSFVDANHDHVRYCPTPDCPMVYLVTENTKLFRCNICSTAICSSCHDAYHLGLTCEENKIEKTDSGKASFEKWMKQMPGDRKRCPKCTVPIEKITGCNHMICEKCKSHMCWLCLKLFPTGSDVYAHQSNCTAKRGNDI